MNINIYIWNVVGVSMKGYLSSSDNHWSKPLYLEVNLKVSATEMSLMASKTQTPFSHTVIGAESYSFCNFPKQTIPHPCPAFGQGCGGETLGRVWTGTFRVYNWTQRHEYHSKKDRLKICAPFFFKRLSHLAFNCDRSEQINTFVVVGQQVVQTSSLYPRFNNRSLHRKTA